MQENPRKGLRERKREETYRAIEIAAVETALELGYEATTAEAIAARANVSLRTLFNYFPSKDQAIVGRSPAVVDDERASELLDECEPDVFRGIARIMAAATSGRDVDTDLRRQRRELIFRNAALLQLELRAIERMEAALAKTVADYFRAKPSRRRLAGKAEVDEEARLVVTLAGAAMRYSTETWLKNDGASRPPAEEIEDTINLMAEISRENREQS